jgi:hypothetical protein
MDATSTSTQSPTSPVAPLCGVIPLSALDALQKSLDELRRNYGPLIAHVPLATAHDGNGIPATLPIGQSSVSTTLPIDLTSSSNPAGVASNAPSTFVDIQVVENKETTETKKCLNGNFLITETFEGVDDMKCPFTFARVYLDKECKTRAHNSTSFQLESPFYEISLKLQDNLVEQTTRFRVEKNGKIEQLRSLYSPFTNKYGILSTAHVGVERCPKHLELLVTGNIYNNMYAYIRGQVKELLSNVESGDK